MENKKLQIEKTLSKIEWVGRKVTGSHNGTIAIKGGEVILKDGRLVGGEFVVDTTSIRILDITDPATNAQFAGHLASEDFFSSEKFPEATFKIVSVVENHIVGELTIKDITHGIRFDAAIESNEDQLSATARLVIDRTKYDMKFRSGNFFTNLGDTLIYNEIELNVSLAARVRKVNAVPIF